MIALAARRSLLSSRIPVPGLILYPGILEMDHSHHLLMQITSTFSTGEYQVILAVYDSLLNVDSSVQTIYVPSTIPFFNVITESCPESFIALLKQCNVADIFMCVSIGIICPYQPNIHIVLSHFLASIGLAIPTPFCKLG